MAMEVDSKKVLTVHYENHRGETGTRRIVPLSIRFGECEWFAGEQWLMEAYDCDKHAKRTFAMGKLMMFEREASVPAPKS
jgi:predicted DNA-binding transcriptional regulator YafY